MEVKNSVTKETLSAVSTLLSPHVPGISPTSLVAALKNHQAEEAETPKFEKPMTRQEVAKALGCSLVTVTRYLNAGKLRRIKLSGRSVRITAESFRKLIEGESAATAAEIAQP